MNELLLIVSIAGSRVALPAAAVESVVELDALIPVPRAPAHGADDTRDSADGSAGAPFVNACPESAARTRDFGL